MTSVYRVERWTGSSAPSARELKQRMELEGFRVFKWRDGPGTYYSPHSHGEEQSHWILAGTLELRVAGFGTFQLVAGDRDFMPAHTEHEATVVGDESVFYLIGERGGEL